MPVDWRETDERLIRRGAFILELSFVENYQTELEAMNYGKEGRPYKLTLIYIQFIIAIRYLCARASFNLFLEVFLSSTTGSDCGA